jgi:uncharacterized protein YybS (DUF2232 family)
MSKTKTLILSIVSAVNDCSSSSSKVLNLVMVLSLSPHVKSTLKTRKEGEGLMSVRSIPVDIKAGRDIWARVK